jgi:hypothetical protein
MSKTNDTKKPRELTDDRPLADSELDAVSGGRIPAQHKWVDISMVRASDPNGLLAWMTGF